MTAERRRGWCDGARLALGEDSDMADLESASDGEVRRGEETRDDGHVPRQTASGPRVGRPSAPTVYGFSRATGPLLEWRDVEARLRDAHTYWLATTRPDGRPHTTPLWGVWVDGALYVSGFPAATWARNLAANPACSAHLESGKEVVILEGTARTS